METSELRRVAQRVTVESPVEWGRIEQQILALPVDHDDAAEVDKATRKLGVTFIVMLALSVGVAFAALAGVGWQVLSPAEPPDWFVSYLPFLFIVSSINTLGVAAQAVIRPLEIVDGAPVFVPLGAIFLAVATALLAATDAGPGVWLGVVTTLISVVGAGILIRCRSTLRYVADLSSDDRWRFAVRALVLERVRHGNNAATLGDGGERSMARMPLGTWHELDSKS